ncbi:hypothetical protein K435DRAFT_822896 [Dendrothele bispora CBS 962.96]|uniref:Uncharacterized protein n=1 Tax=Dendrothele bispora (strain CBS 962.96) TaxID=1314807 RepID=A0A4S8L5S6_DENBC|nr:hypothetical protein K435DRAFT_822896 [Dendrothele bispora CBS 962.96]
MDRRLTDTLRGSRITYLGRKAVERATVSSDIVTQRIKYLEGFCPFNSHIQNLLDQYELNDIKTIYHPASRRPTQIQQFGEYKSVQDSQERQPPPDTEPWRPFCSQTDFEVAELALSSSMNKAQITKLIDLFHRVTYGHDKFNTIQSESDLQKTWELAGEKTTKFVKDQIIVPYRDEEQKFEVLYRPLWDWLEELLCSKEVVSQMEWDAKQLFKFNEKEWCRFIDEPWTADRWWDIQSSLPPNGKPLCVLIYADKNKLSSFGTAKGYPVIARCANLPIEIRNGVGPGGGRVVGWHPIVSEESAHSGKKDFVDFKSIVWHESASKIFESIFQYSQTGYAMICGDLVHRLLFPLLMIASSDYEEQCIMCLIRGLMGLCPCPKCLIPKENLSDLSRVDQPCSASHTVEVHNQIGVMRTKAEKEEILRKYNMRPYLPVFLKMANSDPYSAVSFDDLHFQYSGLGGDHLIPQLKAHISNFTQAHQASTELDKRFDSMPRWRGLNHFKSIMTQSFNDGSKHQDIAKIFLYAAHGIIDQKVDKAAYQLMKCLQQYNNMTMYANLHVQTEDTIASGRKSVQKFADELQKYIKLNKDPELSKSWNFIKLHYHVHLFDDIQQKGVLWNMSTKPNEKFHGPLWKIYHLRTNYKDIVNQYTTLIRARIDALDGYPREDPDSKLTEEDEEEEMDEAMDNAHALGSISKIITLQDIENDHASNSSFSRFRIRLSDFMSDLLPTSGILLPNGKRINFKSHEKIQPYKLLKIDYESLENWHFHDQPRHDFVIFKTELGPVFAQLCYVFTCTIEDMIYPIALVHAYKRISRALQLDKDFGYLRLRREKQSESISVRSIIRGAVVINASNEPTLYEVLLMDVLDSDMFLRINTYFPGCTN